MEFLTALWLPILLSAAGVWIASAIAWTVMPHHRKDWIGLPDEDALVNAVRGLNIPPGNYGFPHAEDCKSSMKDPEFKKKWEAGPTGMISIWPKNISMGRCMVLSFLVYLAVSVVIGYLGHEVLPAGAGFKSAFQVMGTAGILAYCFSHIPSGIWFQAYPRAILMCILDGVAYGVVTGAIFAALWPKA